MNISLWFWSTEPENDESHRLTEIAVVGVGKQIKDMSASQMQKHVSHSPLSSLHGLLTSKKGTRQTTKEKNWVNLDHDQAKSIE
jgi:hypothetical protein